MRKPLRLRSQLSLSMILTAVTTLFIFVSGMVIFYIYLQISWIDGLTEDNRQTLVALIENKTIDPDALTTLVGAFSSSWTQGYAGKETSFLILFTTIAVSFSVLIGLFVSRRISRPIEAVTEAALNVSDGKVDFQVKEQRQASREAHDLLQTFNMMTRSLQQAEREATTSAAAIAHELRTPLTILRGRLQGLNDGAFEPSPDMFQALIGQVDTLSHIVNDLATLSLLSAGQYRPETSLVDLADEARTVLVGIGPSLEKEGIVLEESLNPVKANVDPVRIRQALNALLENACRYAAKGKYIRVETSIERKHAYLRVVDRGPGIANYDRERIFDRWWRAEASRARAEGGSGLGLSVVRAIVLAHGGEVFVSSNTNHNGATFTIKLPL